MVLNRNCNFVIVCYKPIYSVCFSGFSSLLVRTCIRQRGEAEAVCLQAANEVINNWHYVVCVRVCVPQRGDA